MSKPMKLISGLAGVLVLAAVVLTMFGKPPNLPLGPLQGMLAGDEEVVADGGIDPAFTDPGFGGADCSGGSTVPGSGTGAVDPADPAAGDPSAAPTDPAATDPATGAPIASGGAGWTDDGRVIAAGGEYDAGRVSDTRIVAAEATDPATGLAVDPAVTDPALTDPTDPAATDPDALGAGVVDPCTDVGADTGAGDGGAGNGTGAGTGGGDAPAAVKPATTDGTNVGNSPEALRAAKDATGVMKEADIKVATTALLVPGASGVAKGAALRRYRAGVTGAALVIKLDDAAQQQWTGAGKKVQRDLVTSFLKRLGTRYKKASRTITVVDPSGSVLAIGDAAPGKAGSVKLQ